MALYLLPTPPTDFDGPKVFSLQANPWTVAIEAAGKAYESFHRVINGQTSLSHSTFIDDQDAAEEDDPEASKKYAAHKKSHSLDQILGTADYYELLGLTETRWTSTPEDIKKAYRKMCLLHHPDKQANAAVEVDDEVFKGIQTAFETLSNPKTKRAYDSKEPFDDTIPSSSEVKTDADFYTVFGKVFERNSKWATTRMPALGDSETSIQQTNRFYKSWYAMKSWREFSYLDEYEPETAETREEKRWMERKNNKERAKKEREEQQRINSLIDLAYKLDPRIKKQLEEERKEKEEIRQRKIDAVLKKKEYEERAIREKQEKEEEEKRKAEAERKAQSEQNSRINNAKKKRRQKLRQTNRKFGCSERDVEYLIDNLQELDQLTALCSQLDAIGELDKPKLEAFFATEAATIKAKIEEEKLKALEDAKKPKVQHTEAEDKSVWTQNELNLLYKAVTKFPNGTRERWERISEFIGGKKTEKQIIARVKIGIANPQGADDTYQRWLKEKREPKKETDQSGGTENYEAKAVQSPVASPNSERADAKETPAGETEWSPEEQKLLEDALKKFPASLGKDRWGKVAEAVPGRSRRDCVERYKQLVAAIQQRKA